MLQAVYAKQMPEEPCMHTPVGSVVIFPFLPLPVLADNLKSNPGIKWQYFSSEEGIFTVFPAHKFRCKGSYEHRSRYADFLPRSFVAGDNLHVGWAGTRGREVLPDLGTTLDFNVSSEFHTRVCPKQFRNFSLLGSNVCI